MEKFNLIVCGGTFDHLHKGHKSFLRFAFSVGQKILIGLTSDSFVKKTKIEGLIEPHQKRKKVLEEFLRKEKEEKKARLVKIEDAFGPTLKRKLSIDALVVSENLKTVAEVINKGREEKGLPKLSILAYPMVYGEDNLLITSSRIRNGEINRDGRPYINPSWLVQKISLPEFLRKKLKRPFGKLLKKEMIDFKNLNLDKAITVGDVITKTFVEEGLCPKVAVVDFFVERKRKYLSLRELGFLGKEKIFHVDNPASFLTPSLFKAVVQVFNMINEKKNIVIQINGEEDLSVLPLLLRSPLGYTIFYGLKGEGVIKIEVTEINKEKAYKLTSQFIR